MKVERTKNATRNIMFGSALKIYQILLPFIMRTAMLYLLGIEYLGINSLFSSILQVLNLAELGVGSAMVFSMYRPIADGDNITICALMKLYRLYYRIIGIVILIAGLILLPFLPHLISGVVPADINIYVLYLLNLFATVLTYWLFAYKNSVLQAHQRVDVINKVTIVTETIKYILQLTALALFHNYYYFVIVILFTQVITNMISAYFSNKMYPNYKPKGELDKNFIKQINTKIKDLFTSKIGGVIVNSADTVVISAFLGLQVLAIYQNYFYILTAVIGIVGVIFTSCTAGIGNSLIVESEEKNYKDLKKFTFLIAWIAGFCTVALLCLFQPFMEIWVGKDLMLEFSAVICFCIYYFVYEINTLLNLYKDAAGIWHEDRFRPLATALANLVLNLIFVQFWGIYGVLLSTVLSSLIVGMPWLLHNLFTVIFKFSSKEYIKKLLEYVLATLLVSAITYYLVIQVPLIGLSAFIVKMIICTIVPNLLFFLIYKKMAEYGHVKTMLLNILRKGSR